jgi:exodeoxyribonuclease-5
MGVDPALLAMEGVILAPQQELAVEAVRKWLEEKSKPFFFLAGFAGTGKSTCAFKLASLQSGKVKFACATGKAARVLTRKGCPASTVHSLVYLPLGDINEEITSLEKELAAITTELGNLETLPSDARKKKLALLEDKIFARLSKLREPKFLLNERVKPMEGDFDELGTTRRQGKSHPLDGVSLLVLDEVSLLNEEVATDLMSFNIPLLVLGDPGQLPPVQGAGYFTERTPDFMLTEIHRQAADNPIIKIATLFREGKTPAAGKYGNSRVTTRFKLTDADFLWADQVICGSNKNRVSLNNKIRALRGFTSPFPQKGERLMCLRNNKQAQIFNGQIFVALSDFDVEHNSIDLIDDEDKEHHLIIHPECFTRPAQVAAWDYRKRSLKNEFDFSYVCTCHKFQGSEDSKILVYGDALSWMRDRDDLKKWCYTASSRAADELVFAL